ncbi:MAG TPA: hypothetical protein VK995_06935, partial [Oceanipulchritudo sp.]|nr:hypothetical protein [Oceanipulchritudo sp.]
MEQDHINASVRHVWQHHSNTLVEALDETIRDLRNLLRLDEYHRHGHDEERLKEVMGPFASTNLNLSSLSEVLGSSAASRCLPDDRLQRINKLVDELEALKASCGSEEQTYPLLDIEEEETVIHQQAEEHLNKMAVLFRNLRVAQLEIRSKYHPATHDAVFENFGWRSLSPAELRLCPPFLIVASLDTNSGKVLRKIMSLLESRKPLKVAALRCSLRKDYSPTADPTVPATMAVETLPLAMRGVFFLQTCVAAPGYSKQLFEALTSPRPSLISLLAQK